jgi:hypothetical protein
MNASKDTMNKFPFVDTYILNLKYKNASEEWIANEVDCLNKISLYEDPMPFSHRLGVATISSINPLGPLGFIMGYMATSDQCPVEYRKAEYRYKHIASKL